MKNKIKFEDVLFYLLWIGVLCLFFFCAGCSSSYQAKTDTSSQSQVEQQADTHRDVETETVINEVIEMAEADTVSDLPASVQPRTTIHRTTTTKTRDKTREQQKTDASNKTDQKTDVSDETSAAGFWTGTTFIVIGVAGVLVVGLLLAWKFKFL